MTPKHTRMGEFGAELRRLRVAAGLSTLALGELIHFSKGYISKVETGQKSPSPHFVRKADAALSAEGRLITLATQLAGAVVEAGGGANPRSPTLRVAIDRQSVSAHSEGVIDETEARYALAAFESIFEKLRDLGQTLDPSTVADMLKPHVLALQDLAVGMASPLAEEVLLLAAHFADLTSWMTQETGDDVTALRWIDTSATLAAKANNDDMLANSYLRRANIALYQQDSYGTITFAKQAQVMECSPRVKGLAFQREAQGHALAGNYEEFSACIDRAAILNTSAEEQPDGPIPGPTKIRDPLALATGWSLYDLGRTAEAIQILEPLLAQTPKKDNRAWVRIACRLALAYASMRDVDRARDLAKDILALSTVARSATIRSDLRQLSRMLNRWSSDPAVRDIMPSLSAALLPISDSRWAPPAAPGN